MKAKEFVRKQKQIMFWGTILSINLAMFAFLAVIGGPSKLLRHDDPSVREVVIMFLAPLGIFFVAFLTTKIVILRWFKKRHPEMQFLEKWIAVHGSPDWYPTTMHERINRERVAIEKLNQLARCANAAFLLRNVTRRNARLLPENCPERIALEAIIPAMEESAAIMNQEYLDRFDLFRDIFDPSGKVIKDPRQYREELPNQ